MIWILQKLFPNPPGTIESHSSTQMVLQNRDDFFNTLLDVSSLFSHLLSQSSTRLHQTISYQEQSSCWLYFHHKKRLVLNLLNRHDTKLH
jgi:hypothetical protein